MMQKTKDPFPLTDPYTASSLLQKAIRRGETDLAIEAAHLLLRQRGRHTWRRLLIVAFEDVGLGNLKAVETATQLAEAHLNRRTKRLTDGLELAIEALSESTKSRATDHLACGAALLSSRNSLIERTKFENMGEFLHVAGDPQRKLVERAAVLTDCLGRSKAASIRLLIERMNALEGLLPRKAASLVDLCLKGFNLLQGSFVLTLPLLQSEIEENNHVATEVVADLPAHDWIGRLPSYVFDKHTSVGKRALRRFAQESAHVAQVLDDYVAVPNRVDAVCMAAFYADAVPLDRHLVWPGAEELERSGLCADMNKVGCPPCGIDPLIAAVTDNLDHLNGIRIEFSGWSAT